MNKYKVHYTIFSNTEWYHKDCVEFVEAINEEEAKNIIENRSDWSDWFSVQWIEEIK